MKHTPLLKLACALLAFASLLPAASPPAAAATTPGTIAYVRPNDATGDEIWLIQPDGSNNRRVWSVGEPDPNHIFAISDLDWRPDAGMLAFSSNHESACSFFETDIYAVRPDGGDYRRLTNGPACGALASYPKGTVTVTVRNFTTRGPFFVYVQGAPGIQMVLVPPGGATTVTFTDVADFGATEQVAVVIEGPNRWIAPIAAADVQPGQTVHAGTVDVAGTGIEQYGAHFPSWHRSGSRLGYSLNAGAAMWQISATPGPGELGAPLLNAQNIFVNALDWGPTQATADQLLYYSYLNGGIFRVKEGSANGGTRLVATEGHELLLGLQWLPDGSGFVFAKTGDFLSNANAYRYDFASGATTPLTDFTDEFVGDISVSADGQLLVFERAPQRDSPTADLWVMRRDGSGMRLLVRNGLRPSWSQRAPQTPKKVFVPLSRR